MTDASDYAIGDILSQDTIGKDLSVIYTFRLLNKSRSILQIQLSRSILQ